MHNEELQEWYYFSSSIYQVKVDRYLNLLKKVSKEYQDNIDFKDEIYPLVQTENFQNDERLSEFVLDVSQTGWNILSSQGYSMDNLNVYIGELWLQSHFKYSSIDIHTHGYGSQLSAFYILESEDESCKFCIHDPRPTKIQSELYERNMSELSYASKVVEFDLESGDLIFTNSWLPHSFTRNRSNRPFQFIHMNLYVENNICNQQMPIVI